MNVPGLLRRSGFRTLLVGQGVSALGDWMGTIAFMALVNAETGSSTAVGGILALRLLPAAIGGPLAARAANRWDRRRTMVAMDLARAGMIAVVPLVRTLWWVYLWAFMIEVGSLVFLPARDASIPDLVEREELSVANGLVLGSSYGTIPLGAGVFALVAALPGHDLFGRSFALVFWLDAASFLVSAAMIAHLTRLDRSDRAAAAMAPAVDSLHDAAPARFRDAFRLTLVRAVMPATLAVALGLGSLFSLGIIFVHDVLRASDAQFGALIALFGAGAAGGLGLLQACGGFDGIRASQIGVAALGLIVAAFSLAPTVSVAFVGAAAFGAATAWTLSSGMGALQSALDGRDRVLAFAAFHTVIRFGLAFAALGAGVAAEFVGRVEWPVVGTLEPTRVVLLCSGLLVLASATLVRVRPTPAGTRRRRH